MRTLLSSRIRKLLRANEDGLTTAQIGSELGVPAGNVRIALKGMPDTYVDRWVPAPRGAWAAVHCIVVPPPDCPRPTRGVQ